jgi:hypothetical protein
MPSKEWLSRWRISAAIRTSLRTAIRWSSRPRRPWTARGSICPSLVKAPADGIVTKVEQLQVGDYIAASVPVFALVSTHDVWVEANFKEAQLDRMRAGQPATVEIDRIRGKRFSARVASVSPGTGSQFSMLPPENATGNWVKVVQRVPVRLQLDHLDPGLLLQSGLSASVTVDTRPAAVAASSQGEAAASEANAAASEASAAASAADAASPEPKRSLAAETPGSKQ